MKESKINISVKLNDNRVPQQIIWGASDTSAENMQAKAMSVAFWDGSEKSAMRIDLWTKDMMIDEMADFYFQIFHGMAQTFRNATKITTLSSDIKKFAFDFREKFAKLETAKAKEKEKRK